MSERLQRLGLAAAPALVAVLLYLPTLRNGFAWDDSYLVVENRSVHSFRGAPEWFARPWAGSATGRHQQQNAMYWRPLSQASYALDWQIGGGRPWAFHLSNTLLHALSALLVTLLILAVARSSGDPADRPARLAAMLGGVLFAVHAVNSEAVGLVTYRTTLLSSACVLAALLAHVGDRAWCSTVAALGFALGLMAKESAAVLPGLALVVDLATGRARDERLRLARRYAGLALVLAAYLVVHRSVTGPPLLDFFAGASHYEVVLTMLKVMALYLRLVVIPYPLTPFYDWSVFPVATRLLDAEVIGGALATLLLLAIALWSLLRRRGTPLLAVGFYLVALSPFLHFLPFFDVAGERFLYLPLAGLCIGAGLALARAWRRGYRPRALAALALALLVTWSALTLQRLPHLDSTHSLLLETTRLFPYHMSAHYELGRSFATRGEREKAIAAFRQALKINPELEVARAALTRLRAAP